MEGKLIRVVLSDRPVSAGGPVPLYDVESGILEVPIIDGEDWTNGFDLDALVVVDVTDDHAVANIDVLVPLDGWTPGLPLERLPRRPGLKRLHVDPEVLAAKSIASMPGVFVSEDGDRVQLVLPGRCEGVRAVPISHHCDALVIGDELIGFQVQLASGHP